MVSVNELSFSFAATPPKKLHPLFVVCDLSTTLAVSILCVY